MNKMAPRENVNKNSTVINCYTWTYEKIFFYYYIKVFEASLFFHTYVQSLNTKTSFSYHMVPKAFKKWIQEKERKFTKIFYMKG